MQTTTIATARGRPAPGSSGRAADRPRLLNACPEVFPPIDEPGYWLAGCGSARLACSAARCGTGWHRPLRRVMWVDLRVAQAEAHEGVGGDGCSGAGEQAPEGVGAV